MFALPQDYATAQDAGNGFAADYYGRMNASAESVADMFTESSRYYTTDSPNDRPAVGRVHIFREVCRFMGAFGGGRVVRIVSVDARTDGDGPAKNGLYDEYGWCGDEDDDRELRLAMFVRAQWTGRSSAPLPFVQTFSVRWLPSDRHRDRFMIVSTVVNMMATALVPPPPSQNHQLQQLLSRIRRPDANPEGFSNSGHEENVDETLIRGESEQETYAADYNRQLYAKVLEFDLWSSNAMLHGPPTLEFTTDDENELTEAEKSSAAQDFLAYQEQVKKFIEKQMIENPLPTITNTDISDGDDGDDDDGLPTDRMRVGRLDRSITADQLYAAFGRYGKVRWVRVFPAEVSRSGNTAHVCFEGTNSVDRVMDDHRGPGFTIKGVRVSFKRSKPGQ